ncbi:uncharacterized protein LOC111306644 [Durio zibethinus]|uniref:Uncharacterized protein LOC111306644 n=1 Tax=Durio zibethinus TaxID=66656 RepID=A0A6P6A5X3_DURZI|nr:uncharacterized protein LOC111306644 [Durio zibethinus]
MRLQYQNSNFAAVQSLSFDDIADFFSLPPLPPLKMCCENGLDRWPYHKFLAGKSIEEIKRHAAGVRRKEIRAVKGSLAKLSTPKTMNYPNYKLSQRYTTCNKKEQKTYKLGRP